MPLYVVYLMKISNASVDLDRFSSESSDFFFFYFMMLEFRKKVYSVQAVHISLKKKNA